VRALCRFPRSYYEFLEARSGPYEIEFNTLKRKSETECHRLIGDSRHAKIRETKAEIKKSNLRLIGTPAEIKNQKSKTEGRNL